MLPVRNPDGEPVPADRDNRIRRSTVRQVRPGATPQHDTRSDNREREGETERAIRGN
jgi:hypothetical protein